MLDRHPFLRRAKVAAVTVGHWISVRAPRSDPVARTGVSELDGRARLRRFLPTGRVRHDLAGRRASLRVHHAPLSGIRWTQREPRAVLRAGTDGNRRLHDDARESRP